MRIETKDIEIIALSKIQKIFSALPYYVSFRILTWIVARYFSDYEIRKRQ